MSLLGSTPFGIDPYDSSKLRIGLADSRSWYFGVSLFSVLLSDVCAYCILTPLAGCDILTSIEEEADTLSDVVLGAFAFVRVCSPSILFCIYEETILNFFDLLPLRLL